jgi:hypothetical protein
MKALSGYPQWMWLLAKGWKDVENRHWKLPRTLQPLPVRIYLHASKHLEPWDNLWLAHNLLTLNQWADLRFVDWKQYKGAIIGEADILSCSYRFPDENDNLYSPWHMPGQFGFKMANPVLYDKPIPYKGQLRFFEVELPKPPVFLIPTDNGFQELRLCIKTPHSQALLEQPPLLYQKSRKSAQAPTRKLS